MASTLRFVVAILTVFSITGGTVSAYAVSKHPRSPRGVIQNIREDRNRPSLPDRPRPVNPNDLPTPHPHPYPVPQVPVYENGFTEGGTSNGGKTVWKDIKVEPVQPVYVPSTGPKFPYMEPMTPVVGPVTMPDKPKPQPVEGVGVITLPALTQTVKFYGKVQDAETNRAISGARIYSVTSKKESFSASDGSYALNVPVSDQSQVIQFSAAYYQTFTARTTISSSSGDVLLHVTLQPAGTTTVNTVEENVSVYGWVEDARTRKRLEGVKIYSQITKATVYSDQTGAYSIPVVKDVIQTITFSKSGYQTFTARLNPDSDVKLVVPLTK